MATNPSGTLYPLAEMFTVETDANNSVDVWNIPKDTIITRVLLEVDAPATGSANNIVCGDDDDADGFIASASICGVTAGTIYGDSYSELGAYLLDATYHASNWKVYSTAGKELKIKASAAATTEATIKVYVFGYRVPPIV